MGAAVRPASSRNNLEPTRSLVADVALWTPVVKALGVKID